MIPTHPQPSFYETTVVEVDDRVVTHEVITPIIEAPPWDFAGALADADAALEANRRKREHEALKKIDNELMELDARVERIEGDPTQACGYCGRDNENGTHTALEMTGHLSHEWNPDAEPGPELTGRRAAAEARDLILRGETAAGLRSIAREHKIAGYSKMNRNNLIVNILKKEFPTYER